MSTIVEIDPLFAEHSIHGWIIKNEIKNEKGDPITFTDHLYLWDIYLDQNQLLAVMKCAQVGMSTCSIIKNHFDARNQKIDIIYTLPTDSDVQLFVAGKVNRIIANNDCMLQDVQDKDSIQQKQIRKSTEYFRGTWGERSTDMITADRLVHDEIDTSKMENVRGLQARLQHSKLKQTHVFAHPSTPKNGVHQYWLLSDMKEWFIQCRSCQAWQTLSWSLDNPRKMSIDIKTRRYRCKNCDATLSDSARAYGHWRHKKGRAIGTVITEPDGKQWTVRWSGYHINLMMSVQTEASEIVDKWNEVLEGRQSIDFFYSRVLGLPYAGGGNSVGEEEVLACWTNERNTYPGRLVIGVDTGIKLRYVVGNSEGLVAFGQMESYEPREQKPGDPRPPVPLEESLEYFLVKFPGSIMLIDQGGDIVGARSLQKKYPGRVFLVYYRRDRKTMKLIDWGEDESYGGVVVDRNRMIQLIADEIHIKGLRIFNGAAKEDWKPYAEHWGHIYRVWKKDELGVNQYVWMRNDRDDWVHATVYFRTGLSRFGQTGKLVHPETEVRPNSYMINPDGRSVSFNPDEIFRQPPPPTGWIDDDGDDWR